MEAILQKLLEQVPGRYGLPVGWCTKGEPSLSARDWAGTLWSVARCRARAPQPLLEAACRAAAGLELLFQPL